MEGWPCTPVPGNLLVQQDSCLGLGAGPGLSCRGGRAAWTSIRRPLSGSLGPSTPAAPCKRQLMAALLCAHPCAPELVEAGGAAISGGWLAGQAWGRSGFHLSCGDEAGSLCCAFPRKLHVFHLLFTR